MNVLGVFGFIIIALTAWIIYRNYKKTEYYKITKNTLLQTLLDKGRIGEYLIYKRLRLFEKDGARFLFNSYLPRSDEGTTEIDVLMIHKSGIYVFESKNYSGWIFGSEKAKTWTQVLPQGRGKSRKEHFLNPLLQNKLHIKCLKELLTGDALVHSVIVFSERCTLKKVEVTNPDVYVIRRMDVEECVRHIGLKAGECLKQEKIDDIYEKLYPYSQVSEAVKNAHIANIQEKAEAKPLADKVKVGEDELEKECSKVNAEMKESMPTDSVESELWVCPRCGRKLILREAKKGENKGKQFYGCSGFPKCKYIQNM